MARATVLPAPARAQPPPWSLPTCVQVSTQQPGPVPPPRGKKPKSSPQPTRPCLTSPVPSLPSPPSSPPLAHSAPHRQASFLCSSNMVLPQGLCTAMPTTWGTTSGWLCPCPTLDPCSHLSPGLRAASSQGLPAPASCCACHMHLTLYCPLTCTTEAAQRQVWTLASLVPAAQDRDLHRMYHQSWASAHCRGLTSFLLRTLSGPHLGGPSSVAAPPAWLLSSLSHLQLSLTPFPFVSLGAIETSPNPQAPPPNKPKALSQSLLSIHPTIPGSTLSLPQNLPQAGLQ